MKLLLDECVPSRLKKDFPGHEIQTADEAGWRGLKNGDLLRAAAAERFVALITVDRRMPFQQNLADFSIALVTISVVAGWVLNLAGPP